MKNNCREKICYFYSSKKKKITEHLEQDPPTWVLKITCRANMMEISAEQ